MSTYPFKYYICVQTPAGRRLGFFVTTSQPLDTKEAFELAHASIRADSTESPEAVITNLSLVSPGYGAAEAFTVLTAERVS